VICTEISNLMHKILVYLYIIRLLKSSTCFEHCPCLSSGGLRRNCVYAAQDSHLQRVTIPEGCIYTQLRRRPSEDEQGNARNMKRILINVLYVNKEEFCASSWKSTKVNVSLCSLLTFSRE
jgi:hypothetical protein